MKNLKLFYSTDMNLSHFYVRRNSRETKKFLKGITDPYIQNYFEYFFTKTEKSRIIDFSNLKIFYPSPDELQGVSYIFLRERYHYIALLKPFIMLQEEKSSNDIVIPKEEIIEKKELTGYGITDYIPLLEHQMIGERNERFFKYAKFAMETMEKQCPDLTEEKIPALYKRVY